MTQWAPQPNTKTWLSEHPNQTLKYNSLSNPTRPQNITYGAFWPGSKAWLTEHPDKTLLAFAKFPVTLEHEIAISNHPLHTDILTCLHNHGSSLQSEVPCGQWHCCFVFPANGWMSYNLLHHTSSVHWREILDLTVPGGERKQSAAGLRTQILMWHFIHGDNRQKRLGVIYG